MEDQKKFYSLPKGFTLPHTLSGLPEDASILVGFSGGADSSALLHMLSLYGKATGAKIYAAHINHGIRGAEADRDEEFCRNTAKKYGAEFFSLRADVPAIAKERQRSVETAAREVRYEYFSKIMRENNIGILCVAHNADDNFETILFNISRGSGLSGVCGIPRTRDFEGGIIVRPILEMSKSDIIEYCGENNIEYVTDSTNVDNDYTRNRIRNLVIPELKAICPGAEHAAARLSENLRADALCLDSMAAWFLEETRQGFSIEAEKINGSPSAVTTRAIMTMFKEVSDGVDIEYPHVKAILTLCHKSVPHSSLDLPAGVRAVIENGRLCFTKDAPAQKNIPSEKFCIAICEEVTPISQIRGEIVTQKIQKGENIYKKSMKLFIDSDKIIGKLSVRNRLPGDKIRMNSMGKRIKKMMCDKKIDCQLRPRIPMICDDSGIIAVPFLGTRDGYTANSSSENIISIELKLF
ncbi:MAG: tRNA lysidine(34) synthetase TilS [Ruminococcaceae bacterium]|nr:tRNA lysidine(34) synthetase TilS [Oscillospiraceae bacterium]